jgi:hypothetical protein
MGYDGDGARSAQTHTYMYLKASTAGFATSSREYFECAYWSLATSRTLNVADKWRIILAVFQGTETYRQSPGNRNIIL